MLNKIRRIAFRGYILPQTALPALLYSRILSSSTEVTQEKLGKGDIGGRGVTITLELTAVEIVSCNIQVIDIQKVLTRPRFTEAL